MRIAGNFHRQPVAAAFEGELIGIFPPCPVRKFGGNFNPYPGCIGRSENRQQFADQLPQYLAVFFDDRVFGNIQ